MIKKVKILTFVLFFFNNFFYGQVSHKEILKASENFIAQNSIFKGFSHKSQVINLFSEKNIVAHLVQLNPKGYIIFTSSKNLYPIFSYSEKSNFNIKAAIKNPIFKSFLNNIKEQSKIAKLQTAKNIDIIRKNNNAWNKLITNNKDIKSDYQFGILLPDSWGGVNCWDNENNFIYPSSYFTPDNYSPGCVAISASQILHYYQWPPVGNGSHTDYDSNGASQGSYYARFGSMFYDWENMLNDYQGEYSTDNERRAIGRLMYHVGVAVDMDYEDEGSTSHANRVPNAFQSFFRTTGHYQSRSWSEFGKRLRINLENGIPVEFGIEADNGDAHACVCDGYRYNEGDAGADKFYHLNMGWWNWYGGNAWYKIFDDFNAVGYTIITGGVFDILPKPMMNSIVRTSDYHQFVVNWNVSKKLNWEAFELQESYNNGVWATIDNNISDTLYERTVTQNGVYKYRVRTKVAGAYYSDSYSNVGVVQVGETVFLDFDGDDSFFVNDSYNNLDISENWTYEAWVKINSYNSSDWSVITDRRNVFSLYLIDDADADFAVRFVARDGSDAIVASLRSDNSDINLKFDKWFHVAVSRDGTTTRLFLNGNIIEESSDANFILSNSTSALNIGARYWGSYSRYLNGQLDEISLSSKARYIEEFCPSRFKVFENDNYTRVLLNLQYGTGTSLFDASRNFLSISLRSSPNTANWMTEVTPIVNTHPKNIALCAGNTSFSINTENTDTYQWQINQGSGFINFVDNGNVTGATTNTLQINNVSSFSEENIVRCILSNSTVPYTCSQDAMFSIYGNCTIWNGATWSNELPNETKSAIIDANYTSNEFLTTNNLIINENDTLFINENYTLKVEGNLLNKGTLVLKSENADQVPGTFLSYGKLTNCGIMVVQKKFEAINANTNENSYLFSNPILNSQKISNVFSSSSNIFMNSGNVDEWEQLSAENELNHNSAYLMQNNMDEIMYFEGTLINGKKNKELKQLGSNDFFALIPNPYSSYINWSSESGWNKQNVASVIYTYDILNNGNSFNYSVWDGEVGLHSGNGYIKPMEAYFIYMTDYRANIVSDNEVRVSTEDVITSKITLENLIRFKFETEDENIYDEAVVYFGDTERNTLKVLPLSDEKFYTFFPLSGKKYTIKKFIDSSLDTLVSVGFKTSQPGKMKFRVTEFTFDDTTPVQLKDLWTGEYKMLKLDSVYSFTASASEPDNRFKLYFGNKVVSINDIENDNYIKAWSSKNSVFIKNLRNEKLYYNVFDISGKLIKEGSSKNEFIIIKNINTGIKILKVKTKQNTKVYKLILSQ